jgi:hypothetical protein
VNATFGNWGHLPIWIDEENNNEDSVAHWIEPDGHRCAASATWDLGHHRSPFITDSTSTDS